MIISFMTLPSMRTSASLILIFFWANVVWSKWTERLDLCFEYIKRISRTYVAAKRRKTCWKVERGNILPEQGCWIYPILPSRQQPCLLKLCWKRFVLRRCSRLCIRESSKYHCWTKNPNKNSDFRRTDFLVSWKLI